ncbi:MAG TPA: hypothetical protein H9758_00520 [Candidatus Mediterraneibacter faecipullorum]|uniref:Uncharacterized protein n=1 Tax=Candidatus Mediterraneibacter faecipullorum TaxID=2838670 RepID=A0A9D2ST95_9FIRM|nr:hypothetical protein [Candidatus Mediterraneibacter faecipullorum]
MELYEVLYEERFSAVVLSRITKTILVFLIFCVMAANVHFNNPAAGQSISADTETILPAGAEAEIDAGWSGTALSTVNEMILKPIISVTNEFMIPVVPSVFPAEPEDSTVYMPEAPAATVPEEPEVSVPEGTAPVIPEVPEASVPEEPATSVPEEPAISVPDDPAEQVPPENTGNGSVPGVIDGFLVNESGIIYGISDPDLVVNDGYMEFPTEKCTGIAAGTFSSGLPTVREIFIPANITYIEEGAFSGLANMEWFEMESSGAYYTEEGVLFAEHGTCLLAFPAGRTGNYKVPSHVVRFAAGSFDSAQIEVLDATACILTDVSGIPENISLLVRETP